MNKPYEIIADTRKMSHQDWLTMRKAGIGGSDSASAALIGSEGSSLSRWKSPFTLWAEKTDRIIPAKANNESLYWGGRLEEILKCEVKRRKPELEVHDCPFFLRSKEYPFMIANLDGYVKNPDGSFSVLEIKTAGAYAVQDWQDGLPIEYYCQVMHYMAVTGMSSAYVAVLLGGNEFRIQRVDREESMVQILIQGEKRFWDYVVNDTPPEARANDLEALNLLYPKAHEKQVELPAEAKGILTDYEKASHDLELAKKAKEMAEAKLKAMMADAEIGVIGSHRISWKNVSTTRLNSTKIKSELLTNDDLLKEYSSTSVSRTFKISAARKK